jgi:hypothetical protein
VFVNASENGCEDIYSTQVTVTVTPDITISAQPVGGSICTGGNLDLECYREWFSGYSLSVGTTNRSNHLDNSRSGFSELQYRSLDRYNELQGMGNADESGCEDVYSSTVIVTVFPDISISAQPVVVRFVQEEIST